MEPKRIEWDGSDPRALAERLRAMQPRLDEVSEAVAEIIDSVASGGDSAVLDAEKRFGGSEPAALAVARGELEQARDALDTELREAIELAERNIRRVAEAEAKADLRVTLDQGQGKKKGPFPLPLRYESVSLQNTL